MNLTQSIISEKPTPHIENFIVHDEIDILLKERYPHRNDKYYQILLQARLSLVEIPYKLKLTSEALIKSSQTARPTWYTYFKSVKQYYADVLDVVGGIMLEHALAYLRERATFSNWNSVVMDLKMLVFLSNCKNIVAYFPDFQPIWHRHYNGVIDGYANILGPILKLSPGRANLFVRNFSNELILNKEKYFANLELFDQYIDREYSLFLTEQNS